MARAGVRPQGPRRGPDGILASRREDALPSGESSSLALVIWFHVGICYQII